MLIERHKPAAGTFTNYLKELADDNGFESLERFKQHLVKVSKWRYDIDFSSNTHIRVVVGLFIELGIDKSTQLETGRRLCFSCLQIKSEYWVWKQLPESICANHICTQYFEEGKLTGRSRNHFCGISRLKINDLCSDIKTEDVGKFFNDGLCLLPLGNCYAETSCKTKC